MGLHGDGALHVIHQEHRHPHDLSVASDPVFVIVVIAHTHSCHGSDSLLCMAWT